MGTLVLGDVLSGGGGGGLGLFHPMRKYRNFTGECWDILQNGQADKRHSTGTLALRSIPAGLGSDPYRHDRYLVLLQIRGGLPHQLVRNVSISCLIH